MSAKRFSARDIPQSDNLARVRQVIEAIADGVSDIRTISELTAISARHVAYSLCAARVLGWIDDSEAALTAAGAALLTTIPEGLEERSELRRAILTSELMRAIAPDLLHAKPLEREELADRILSTVDGLSRSTALRRAQAILAWRTYLL